jgi:hypothetical protein
MMTSSLAPHKTAAYDFASMDFYFHVSIIAILFLPISVNQINFHNFVLLFLIPFHRKGLFSFYRKAIQEKFYNNFIDSWT